MSTVRFALFIGNGDMIVRPMFCHGTREGDDFEMSVKLLRYFLIGEPENRCGQASDAGNYAGGFNVMFGYQLINLNFEILTGI